MSTIVDSIKTSSYFTLRNVKSDFEPSGIPKFLIKNLPSNKDLKILDIGCGYCHMLQNFRYFGYPNVFGIDISNEAVENGKKINIPVLKIESIIDFAKSSEQKYDFIILTHVIEHLEKDKIIDTLNAINDHLLGINGQLYITVPNAQSNTDCYWMYEDFTHTTLFTTGSLFYVLNAAGFKQIEILDSYSLEGLSIIMKIIKQFLLNIYSFNRKFWNKVTNSSYHASSPIVYSFELRIIAKK